MRKDRIRRKKRGSRLVKLKDIVGKLQCELRFESSQKAKAELNVMLSKTELEHFGSGGDGNLKRDARLSDIYSLLS